MVYSSHTFHQPTPPATTDAPMSGSIIRGMHLIRPASAYMASARHRRILLSSVSSNSESSLINRPDQSAPEVGIGQNVLVLAAVDVHGKAAGTGKGGCEALGQVVEGRGEALEDE